VHVKVLKFGGSSFYAGDDSASRQILLATRRREPLIVVVSAFEGVTNQLLECARLAERADARFEESFGQVARRHQSAVRQLIGRGQRRIRVAVDALLTELGGTLKGIHLLRHCPLRALDMTASFGERLSALIVSGYLNQQYPAAFVDARDFLVTDDQFTHANVLSRRPIPLLANCSHGLRGSTAVA
jgi:aspartokinase/homoserine dehydrogenase 1